MVASGPRRLLLLRHAKSDWPEGVADHDRPLAPRGRRDAAAAGAWLAATSAPADLVLCSTARRTRETWESLQQGGATGGEVQCLDEIYAAAESTLADLVRKVPARVEHLLLIGHAPGVPALAEALCHPDSNPAAQSRLRAKYPTCGLAVLELPSSWARLDSALAELVAFWTPHH